MISCLTVAGAAARTIYFGFLARFSSTETSLSPYTMTEPVLSSKREDGTMYGAVGAAGKEAEPMPGYAGKPVDEAAMPGIPFVMGAPNPEGGRGIILARSDNELRISWAQKVMNWAGQLTWEVMGTCREEEEEYHLAKQACQEEGKVQEHPQL